MAKPLSNKGPQATIPATPPSDSGDHFSIAGGKAQATPKPSAFANNAMRSGRSMRAGESAPPVKSKGNIKKATLS